jgi:hypothetical protein
MREHNEASHAGEKAAEVLGGITAFSFCQSHAVLNQAVFGSA